MLLDHYMPNYHFTEKHIIHINASPQQIFQAFHRLSPSEISLLFRILFFFRSIPSKLLGKRQAVIDPDQPLMQQLENEGFTILKTTQSEIVIGVIGQFWKPVNDKVYEIHDAGDFISFNQNNYGKVACNFLVTENPEDSLLSTETRIYLPDEKTRKKFGRYWMIIHPGSAIIRRIWLQAIRKRAEMNI